MKDISIGDIKLFFCYAHQDKLLRDELDTHLASVKRQQQITSWYDGEISPGMEREREVAQQLESADIVLLLVSADFLSSSSCYSVEMKHALERHEAGTARVIPIIVRAVYWEKEPFSKLHVLPTEAKPVASWPNRDEAWRDVVTGIYATAKDLRPFLPVPHEMEVLPKLSQARTAKPQTLSEFFKQFVRLQTNLERILVFGYWFEIKQSQAYFTVEDILAKYKEIGEKSPANLKRDLNSLVSKGFLLPPEKFYAGASQYALSNSGIDEVEVRMVSRAKKHQKW